MPRKSSFDKYLAQQMKDPRVRRAFYQERNLLSIGLALANERKKQGLTQEDIAKRIGTSTPQISRTEQRPERSNVSTLIRYAEAVGMKLDIRLTGT